MHSILNYHLSFIYPRQRTRESEQEKGQPFCRLLLILRDCLDIKIPTIFVPILDIDFAHLPL